jgi:putative DNA primase/helicase
VSDAEDKIKAAIDHAQVLQDGPASPPEEAVDDAGGHDGEPPPDNVDWELVGRCSLEPQNDYGNSRRWRWRCDGDLLHVQNVDWFAWDARRWAEDTDERRTRPLCHMTVSLIALEAFMLMPTTAEREAIEAAEAALAPLKDANRRLAEIEADREMAKATREERVREIREEIADLKAAIYHGREAKKSLRARQVSRRRFAIASGNTGRIAGMMAEAKAYLSKPMAELNVDPLALNCENGTLRFLSRQFEDPDDPGDEAPKYKTEWRVDLAPHRRQDFITKLTAANYDSQATCPQFEAFIARILPQPSIVAFVQRFFGYCLTGFDREQVFVLFHGEGRNGKSTLVDIVARILADYATSVPISTLINNEQGRKGSEATPDLARLPGARFVRSAEPKEGLSLDESVIKQLTSREPIPVRRLNKDFIDIYPTFKIVISVNRKPTIKGNDDGIWRRVLLIPFDIQIPEAEVDKSLSDKLWEERDGILAWLARGCLDYLTRGGLDPPEEVKAATADYRQESDIVGGFVRAALKVTKVSSDLVEAGELFRAYEVYCRRQGITPLAASTFHRRMPKAAHQFGFEKLKTSISVYAGIQVLDEFVPKHGARVSGEDPRDRHLSGATPADDD